MYDIDGIENPASTVSALHALGDHVICYIEVGTAGNYGGAYSSYYSEFGAAGDLGAQLRGYAENFLNINAASTVTIVESIIHDECAAKGFDAVETDLDETFDDNEGATGFSISESQEVNYLETLATYMHSLGLGWIAKNPDDTGSTIFSNAIEPYADGVITEQCYQYGTCGDLGSFIGRRAIFEAEYQSTPSAFCPPAIAGGRNAVLFDTALDGVGRVPCS